MCAKIRILAETGFDGIKNPDYHTMAGINVMLRIAYSVTCPSTGRMETKDLPSLFFLNSTMPSHSAYNVWSLPMPTFLPG